MKTKAFDLETIRILTVALAQYMFTVTSLAEESEVSPARVRAVMKRHSEFFEQVGSMPKISPGRPPTIWQLRKDIERTRNGTAIVLGKCRLSYA